MHAVHACRSCMPQTVRCRQAPPQCTACQPRLYGQQRCSKHSINAVLTFSVATGAAVRGRPKVRRAYGRPRAASDVPYVPQRTRVRRRNDLSQGALPPPPPCPPPCYSCRAFLRCLRSSHVARGNVLDGRRLPGAATNRCTVSSSGTSTGYLTTSARRLRGSTLHEDVVTARAASEPSRGRGINAGTPHHAHSAASTRPRRVCYAWTHAPPPADTRPPAACIYFG